MCWWSTSSTSRDAIKEKEFKDEKKFRRIMLAIENRILDLLAKKSHMSIVPSVSFSRQLVGILAYNYPYMFPGDPAMTV
jgi:hypothetical protein